MARRDDDASPADLLERLRAHDESAFRHVLWLIRILLKQ
jgi:hypothetical protein